VAAIDCPKRSLILLLTALACSDATSDDASKPSSPPEADAAGVSLPCTDTADPLDLDGLFALSARLNFSFASQPGGAVTVCPTDQTSDGHFLGFVRVQHVAGQTEVPSVSAVICSIDLPVISAIVGECVPQASNVVYAGLEFPKPLIESLPVASSALTTAQLSSPNPGATLSAGSMNFSIGTNERIASAPGWLMTHSGCGMNDVAPGRSMECEQTCVTDCSKLVDDDHDGWPGVSVFVCGYTDDDKKRSVPCHAEEPNQAGATIQGRALMNLLVEPLTLKGSALSSCEVAGSLDAAVAYNVIGADLYLANTPISVTSAIKSLPQYSVNTPQSRFRLVRIDGKHGAWNWKPSWDDPVSSCRQIIANQNDLR